MSAQNRLEKIDFLKGVAISLVVIGHFFPESIATQGYRSLRATIYSFHMPLFMIISGYLYSLSSRVVSFLDYIQFVKHKAIRLVIPYFVIAVSVLLIKIILQNFIPMENPVSSKFLIQLFFAPMGGFATFLWFIYTLFMILLIIPFLEHILKNYLILFILSILLYFVNAPKVFCLNLVIKNLPFFVSGMLINKFVLKKDNLLVIIGLSLGMFTVLANLFLTTGNSKFFLLHSSSLTTALSISLVIWWLSKYMIRLKFFGRWFMLLGIYSASIYLFHTSAMAPVKLLLSDFMKISTVNFHISVFIVCTIGISVPIVLTELVINRSKILSRLFLGVERTTIN